MYCPKCGCEYREGFFKLPIEVTMNPDMWHFSSSEKGKKFFKSYATYPPVAIGVSIIFFVIELLRK